MYAAGNRWRRSSRSSSWRRIISSRNLELAMRSLYQQETNPERARELRQKREQEPAQGGADVRADHEQPALACARAGRNVAGCGEEAGHKRQQPASRHWPTPVKRIAAISTAQQ